MFGKTDLGKMLIYALGVGLGLITVHLALRTPYLMRTEVVRGGPGQGFSEVWAYLGSLKLNSCDLNLQIMCCHCLTWLVKVKKHKSMFQELKLFYLKLCSWHVLLRIFYTIVILRLAYFCTSFILLSGH